MARDQLAALITPNVAFGSFSTRTGTQRVSLMSAFAPKAEVN
jgi:hypothetical protein